MCKLLRNEYDKNKNIQQNQQATMKTLFITVYNNAANKKEN